jgi:hypothetical protein
LGDLNGVTAANHAPVITSGATGTEAENTVITNVVYHTAATDPVLADGYGLRAVQYFFDW